MKVLIIGGDHGEQVAMRQALLLAHQAGGSTDAPAPAPVFEVVLVDELQPEGVATWPVEYDDAPRTVDGRRVNAAMLTASAEFSVCLSAKEQAWLNSLCNPFVEIQHQARELDLSMVKLRNQLSYHYRVHAIRTRPAGQYTPARNADQRRRAKNRAQRQARRK